uniref:MFS domain-containing protein n=1 Tax=Heterorhabditis bacteriophora TaxID=37862 RepID=A0A1I7WMN6_HETBA
MSMNFLDDSTILSKLGILESKEESPKRSVPSPSKGNHISVSEKERFVEVSIDGDFNVHSDSEEEDSIFDRNSLLSSNRNTRGLRRVSESYKCRYFVILATYIAVGSVLYPCSDVLYNIAQFHTPLLSNAAGLVLGSLTGKLWTPRLNLLFLLLICLTLLSGVRMMLFTADNIDQFLISFIEGFTAGAVFYGGMAMWLLYWRGHTRKIIFFYLMLAIASMVILLTGEKHIINDNMTFSHIYKRSADFEENALSSFTAANNELNYNESVNLRPRKPKIVQGTSSIDSKTKENEQMRKAAEEALKVVTNESASVVPELGTVTPRASSITTAEHLSVNNMLTSSTTTELLNSTSGSNLSVENSTTPVLQIASIISCFDRPTGNIVIGVLISTILLYLLGFTFCCFPFSFSADAKIVKVYDPSIPGLTLHCRFRLASVQILGGFLEALFMVSLSALNKYTEGSTRVQYAFGAIVISRFLALLCGSCALTLATCTVLLLCIITGSFILAFISMHSLLGVLLIGFGTGLFGLSTFLTIESRLVPRASVQLNYFVIPSVCGNFLSSLFCFSFCPLEVYQMLDLLLLLSILLTICFLFLARSIQKAARLKEIMEYSSSPLPEASAEYVSLIDRGLTSDIEDEDVAPL